MASPIYKKKDIIAEHERKLLDQLSDAVADLEINMQTSVPITKGTCQIGFGVRKLQRSIAADRVISIAKAIKALKGW
ncbi:hypothetical protein KAR91_66670 [Candidatus Pacearchaeota archaeon]|nr:hypothetical protein [Candidatus Pacearchaeota archaeon]